MTGKMVTTIEVGRLEALGIENNAAFREPGTPLFQRFNTFPVA